MPLDPALNSIQKIEVANKSLKGKNRRTSSRAMPIQERSRLHRWAKWILSNPLFDLVFGCIIMANVILVIIETDAVSTEGETPRWIDTCGWGVLIIFVMELSIRLYVHGSQFWSDTWNLVDFVLVSIDVVASMLSLLAHRLFPVSVLRIYRLIKLARLAKLFKVFPELRLMLHGLLGAFKAIFWGTVLLSFTILVWSIIAVQFIHPLNIEVAEKGDYGDCTRCPRAYSTVWEATITFTQQVVTGDSWGLVSIPIIEHASWTAFFFAAVFLSVGMAVINLILGVVVDVASHSRNRLREEIEDDDLVKKIEHANNLYSICSELDTDGNGWISKDEVFDGYAHNDEFHAAVTSMDVTDEDLEILWTVIDENHSGSVSYAEFISSCYKLKSSNTHFVLAHIRYYVTKIKDKICQQIERSAKAEETQFAKIERVEQQIQHDIEGIVRQTSAGRASAQDFAQKDTIYHKHERVAVRDDLPTGESPPGLDDKDSSSSGLKKYDQKHSTGQAEPLGINLDALRKDARACTSSLFVDEFKIMMDSVDKLNMLLRDPRSFVDGQSTGRHVDSRKQICSL